MNLGEDLALKHTNGKLSRCLAIAVPQQLKFRPPTIKLVDPNCPTAIPSKA